jgi:glycopeptide antibiotics resistance protein
MALVPFENYYYSPLPVAVAEILHKMILGMPLGLFLALCQRDHWTSRAQLPTLSWIMAMIIVLGVIEAVQLLVPSRVADLTDVLLQTCGGVLGWSVVTGVFSRGFNAVGPRFTFGR